MRRLFAAVIGITLLGGPLSTAAAQDRLEIAVGGEAGGFFSGATEIPESSAPDGLYGPNGTWGNGSDPELYGLFGAGGGGGPTLELRYNGFVGLETAVLFTNDTTDGTNDIVDSSGDRVAEITQTQSTTATHVPLLLKVAPDFERVRPVFGLGLQFVFQNGADLSYTTDGAERRRDELDEHNAGRAENYTLFQVTAGVEFDAGPVRVPLEIRTGYNLGWENAYDARVERDPEGQVYDGAYLGHFGVTGGILYTWDVAL